MFEFAGDGGVHRSGGAGETLGRGGEAVGKVGGGRGGADESWADGSGSEETEGDDRTAHACKGLTSRRIKRIYCTVEVEGEREKGG